MDRVIAARVYNRICELGSLSAAARALGISRPMVSRYLEQMEKWAGARLVNRSTRKLTLTAAGEKVLQKTRTLSQISQEIEDQSVKDLPSGTLRVACAHFTAMHIIVPVLPDLLQRYPQLRIELDVNNHPVSLVGERIDVASRITDNPEPGMIARRLGECRSVLCASPHYLASRGVPVQLEDLSRHNCLHYSFCRSVVAFFDARRGVGHDGGQRQSQRQYLVIADGGGDKPLWYCHAARARGRRGATAGQPGAGARRLYAKTDRYFWYLSVARLSACGAACVLDALANHLATRSD